MSLLKIDIFSFKRSSTVAFYVVYEKGRIIERLRGRYGVFDDVGINDRKAYNRYTGTYTVPTLGLYVFHWTCKSSRNMFVKSCKTVIVVNGKKKAGNYASSSTLQESVSGSQTFAGYLDEGDQVWIQTRDGNYGNDMRRNIGNESFPAGDKWTSFGGYKM